MAGTGRAPKDPARRVGRTVPTRGEWTTLPAEGRKGRTPPWPLGQATRAQLGLWQRLWRTPQATEWEGMGLGVQLSLARYVALTFDVQGGDMRASEFMAALPEIRQIEDRLGLNPKGMQDRRWRVAGVEEAKPVPAKPGEVTRMDRYREMAKQQASG